MSKLENALADILQKAASGIDEATVFLSSEIPDVAAQLLTYEIIHNFVFAFIFAASTVALCMLSVKCYKDDHVEALVILTPFSTLTLFLFVSNMMDVIKIWVAPKLYLLEYAADIVK